MISHFNRFLCKEIEMADRVRFMRIKKAGESGDSEVGEKCFAVCAVRMRLVPFDVVLVSKDGLGVLAMNVTRATVGSCVGLPVRSRIADKAWARGMRRETRDARRETRDARRETRAWDWQRGAWAQMQRVRSEAPGAVYAHKLASITECLRVSLWVDAISRSVGPRGASGDLTITMQNAVSRARRSLTTNPAN